ncbi:hypothetical protein BDU57DRAFT_103208 [Ampelomyces quisqualis]|uniref:NB-ARC domain-containing protein n=1 Tax=Ampelomyces quisqualis TaxID=50730 RepID=A0A6A5Q9E7_AMPQU|nr:hypothetical protein BDU57DRAFT_103208 [Ampelomyces quisqualis]
MDPLSLTVGVVSALSVALAVALTPASLRRRVRNAQKKRKTDGDEKSVGLETIAQPTESSEFDICFVHGLGGSARSTWTAYDKEMDKTIFWPKDLLCKSFPRARILLYGYETKVHSLCWLADRTLYHHASHLLSDLSTARQNCQDRPLLFVAHSLGGLVVKSALVFAQGLASTSDNTDRKIYLSTFGIVSFGTPQVSPGSPPLINFVDELCATQQFSELRAFGDSKTRQADMAILQTRLESYKSIAREIPEVFCYESIDSALSTRHATVLPKTPGLRHDLCVEVAIEADHNEMCKFHVDNDDYRTIFEAVSTFFHESGTILDKRRARFDRNIGPDIISGGKIRKFGFSVGPHLPPRNNIDLNNGSKSRAPSVEFIHERLLEARFAWLVGQSGPGKTSFALDYAYQRALPKDSTANFSSIFWVDGRCEESLEASFLRIFDILRVYYEQKQAQQASQKNSFVTRDVTIADTTSRRLSARKGDRPLKVRHVMDWFNFPGNDRWLLIFDDVEHPKAKYWRKYCPRSDTGRGYILMICRKDKFGSRYEQDSETARHSDHHQDSSITSFLPSRVNTEETSSSPYHGSWNSGEEGMMLGLESAPPTESSGEDDAHLPPPIIVEPPDRPTSREFLQRLDSRKAFAIDTVSDSLAGIGASLCAPEIIHEQTLEGIINGGISSELLSWVDASVMLSNHDIPTRFLEAGFGKGHASILRGLDTLQTLGLVQKNGRDRDFHIPEDTWRLKRQELDGSQRSAQLACELMVKTIKSLAKSNYPEADDILDEQLLVEHMNACLEIFGRFNSSVECDWDVLAEFCERNGLYVEATGFYNAQVDASRVTIDRREDTENSDGRSFYDARSTMSLAIPERHHRANSSSYTYDISARPRAYRELYSALGAIRMQTKLGKLEDLEIKCKNALSEVQKHQYHDLEYEALRRLIDLERARNHWPGAIEYIQSLAEKLEERKGPSHPDTLAAIHQLATTHADEGDYVMAEPLLERVLIAYTQMFGHAHLRTVMVSVDLAEVYKNHGNTEKAEPLYRIILKTYRQLLGAEHIQTARAQEGLATVYDMQHEYKLADDHFDMALDYAKLLGEESEEYRGMKRRHAVLKERRS